jgi:hypothetical protein
MSKPRTLTPDDLTIIGMQDELSLFGYDDRHMRVAVNFILDYLRRVVVENSDLRERVATIETKLAEKEGEL